jgi:hypothetical protein
MFAQTQLFKQGNIMAVTNKKDTDKQTTAQVESSAPMADAFSRAQASSNQFGVGNQQQPVNDNGGRGFRNMARGLGRQAMGRTQASEVLTKMAAAMEDCIKKNVDPKFYDVSLIKIEKEQTASLGVSVLVVCLKWPDQIGAGGVFYGLLLEGSMKYENAVFKNIGNKTIEITKVPGDAVDDILVKTVETEVAKRHGQTKMRPVGYMVVPKTFNIADEGALWDFTAHVLFANSNVLETSQPGWLDFNMQQAATQDKNLQVRTTYGNPQTNNVVGLPIRSDIVINFTVGPDRQQQETLEQNIERTEVVTELTGYLDMTWANNGPQQFQPFPQGFGMQQQLDPRRYAARLVLTSIDNPLLTPASLMLSLLPAIGLRENNNWYHGFKTYDFDGNNMHDIGAIGLECSFTPDGKLGRIDTRSSTFTPAYLNTMINTVFHSGLILSMDVSENGPDTWYSGFLADAGTNKSYAAYSNRQAIDAANTVTGGHFDEFYQSNEPVCIDENNRIHAGYYLDNDTRKIDLRNIDYLAVLNHPSTEKDPELARAWSDTFTHSDYDLNMRLAERLRILRGIVTDPVITGFYKRITFTTKFTNALAMAAAKAGLSVRSIAPFDDAGSYQRVANGFVPQTLMAPAVTGIFNRTGNNGQSFNYGQGRQLGRQFL